MTNSFRALSRCSLKKPIPIGADDILQWLSTPDIARGIAPAGEKAEEALAPVHGLT